MALFLSASVSLAVAIVAFVSVRISDNRAAREQLRMHERERWWALAFWAHDRIVERPSPAVDLLPVLETLRSATTSDQQRATLAFVLAEFRSDREGDR